MKHYSSMIYSKSLNDCSESPNDWSESVNGLTWITKWLILMATIWWWIWIIKKYVSLNQFIKSVIDWSEKLKWSHNSMLDLNP